MLVLLSSKVPSCQRAGTIDVRDTKRNKIPSQKKTKFYGMVSATNALEPPTSEKMI